MSKPKNIMTIYGRNSVIEVLRDKSVEIYKLHLASSNKEAPILDEMVEIAKRRDIEIAYHKKRELSFISKNSKQDQGVALDILSPNFFIEESFLEEFNSFRVIALDGVTNPQNIGMIIRSCCAGNIDGIILNIKNPNPLILKASSGTMFKMPIIQTSNLFKTLQNFKEKGTFLYTLSSKSNRDYSKIDYPKKSLFILGNESEGVSLKVENLSNDSIKIPMNRGIDSLNVAISASLLAFVDDK